jgi:hypothetical protein
MGPWGWVEIVWGEEAEGRKTREGFERRGKGFEACFVPKHSIRTRSHLIGGSMDGDITRRKNVRWLLAAG